ncbi:hypothetical protein [Stenotrophomonas sp. PS02298]|uniref:hypothetical protein n=1 Tax=Stenotrophomonas sp. PS02298 TaxID=2991424 RepID=UPI002499CF8F|nr:hypothetical protein [Stenotrophomonas sp. PS02298]
MDDRQRARELLAEEYERVGSVEAARSLRANDAIWNDSATVAAIESALAHAAQHAAPEVGRILALLEQWEQRAAKAYPVDAMLINKHIRELGSVLRGENLLDQQRVAVVADSSQVVPPATLRAHEVHPEAVDSGLNLGEAGERLVAADALEHASGVRQNCDGSATALEVPVYGWVITGPNGSYFCPASARHVMEANSTDLSKELGITVVEVYTRELAARPQGVKDAG